MAAPVPGLFNGSVAVAGSLLSCVALPLLAPWRFPSSCYPLVHSKPWFTSSRGWSSRPRWGQCTGVWKTLSVVPSLPVPDTDCSNRPQPSRSVLSFPPCWKMRPPVGDTAWPQVGKGADGRRETELIFLDLESYFSHLEQPRSTAELFFTPPSSFSILLRSLGPGAGCFASNYQDLHL